MKSIIKSLYIHYPFCSSKCYYCNFYSVKYNKELEKKYTIALYKEYNRSLKKYNLDHLQTIYIGGGTPTININFIRYLLIIISSSITLNSLLEFTVESNPSNLDCQFIELFLKNKVNRISLGVQSFDDNVLLFCNRKQTNLKLLEVLNLFSSDFNLSIDLINGLPHFNPDKELKILNSILSENSSKIKHISFYDLTLENSYFANQNKFQKMIPEEEITSQYEEKLRNLLGSHHFYQYEISNFAKQGYESKHNLTYWNYENYLGLGPSAHSTIDGVRIENTSDLDSYIKNDHQSYELYTLTKKQRIQERLLMGFRLVNGISLEQFYSHYKLDLKDLFSATLRKYQSFFKIKNNRIFLNQDGLLILNTILVDLFIELDDKIE